MIPHLHDTSSWHAILWAPEVAVLCCWPQQLDTTAVEGKGLGPSVAQLDLAQDQVVGGQGQCVGEAKAKAVQARAAAGTRPAEAQQLTATQVSQRPGSLAAWMTRTHTAVSSSTATLTSSY